MDVDFEPCVLLRASRSPYHPFLPKIFSNQYKPTLGLFHLKFGVKIDTNKIKSELYSLHFGQMRPTRYALELREGILSHHIGH